MSGEVTPYGCTECGAPAIEQFHRAGCNVAGGRHGFVSIGAPVCANYPLDCPPAHYAPECSECVSGRAHAGLWGTRENRDRVLFLEIRAIVPSAPGDRSPETFTVFRGRDKAQALAVFGDFRRLILAARDDGRRMALGTSRERGYVEVGEPKKPRGRRTWTLGRLVLTTVIQAQGAPPIDRAFGSVGSSDKASIVGRTFHGRAFRVKPWPWRSTSLGLAVVVGWLDPKRSG